MARQIPTSLVIFVLFFCASNAYFPSIIAPENANFIKKLIGECVSFPKGAYPCLANKAAQAMERATKYDIPLFSGLVLKKNEEEINSKQSSSPTQRPRIFFGVDRLTSAVSTFLDTHTLSLDLTNPNEDDLDKDGEFETGRSTKNDKQLIGGKDKISKKDKKYFQYTLVILVGIFGIIGPILLKSLLLFAAKALVASKIALVTVGSIALKKLFTSEEDIPNVKVRTVPIHERDDHDRLMEHVDESGYKFLKTV